MHKLLALYHSLRAISLQPLSFPSTECNNELEWLVQMSEAVYSRCIAEID